MTQEEIQKNAVQALINNNGGTLFLETGSGKSKIVIDYLMKISKPYETVLITVPLSKLIRNWEDEFVKWTDCSVDFKNDIVTVVIPNGYISVTITTIQTAFKWTERYFQYLVLDEVHTQLSCEYSAILTNLQYNTVIGLTATLDNLRREDKQLLYDKHVPVVFEYHSGEADGVVNKTKLIIVEHQLDDIFRIKVGKKPKQWLVGEKTQYEYLSKMIRQGQLAMALAGSDDYFSDASEWFWRKRGTKEQLLAGQKYLMSITNRRKFLLSLQSTAEITKRLAKQIVLENDYNKVLIFSEQVEQLKKICKFNVFGEQDKQLNDEILTAFNEGSIRALGSVYQLTLGMNLKNVNSAIVESYQGSDVKITQRIGRLHRLETDKTATIYILKVLGTQSEQWFNSMMVDYNLTEAEVINSSEILK